MPPKLNRAFLNVTQDSQDQYCIDIAPIFRRQILPDNVREVFTRFENLSDNREFGLVQRALGIERLGLFRYAGTPSTAGSPMGLKMVCPAPGNCRLNWKSGDRLTIRIGAMLDTVDDDSRRRDRDLLMCSTRLATRSLPPASSVIVVTGLPA